ncbi:hypothetical protein An15g02230 [Aspergillus niger]|uniref:Uncharacterized protein n=2 Tax=Aspergillus niger TaxID=5061 RepID=A2R504_ASPNC|nr:hypothetical protein An15g02230 [Aspergillus niger]CAK42326.1 hypothetical protein An15g02230 [Aspergillus niger]
MGDRGEDADEFIVHFLNTNIIGLHKPASQKRPRLFNIGATTERATDYWEASNTGDQISQRHCFDYMADVPDTITRGIGILYVPQEPGRPAVPHYFGTFEISQLFCGPTSNFPLTYNQPSPVG